MYLAKCFEQWHKNPPAPFNKDSNPEPSRKHNKRIEYFNRTYSGTDEAYEAELNRFSMLSYVEMLHESGASKSEIRDWIDRHKGSKKHKEAAYAKMNKLFFN